MIIEYPSSLYPLCESTKIFRDSYLDFGRFLFFSLSFSLRIRLYMFACVQYKCDMWKHVDVYQSSYGLKQQKHWNAYHQKCLVNVYMLAV